MSTTAENIKVMQAFEDGKEIEANARGFSSWDPARSPIWNWSNYDYRVKATMPKVTMHCHRGKNYSVVEYTDKVAKVLGAAGIELDTSAVI